MAQAVLASLRPADKENGIRTMNRAKMHVRVECMISEVWEQLTGEGEGELAKSQGCIEPEQVSMARTRTKISVLLFASRCIFMTE